LVYYHSELVTGFNPFSMKRRQFIQHTILGSSLLTIGVTQAKEVPTEIINSGVGSNNTVDLLARLDKDCLAHQPDLTVLMVGTNDMNSRKFIPLAEYEKNMRQIIERILAIKSKILLMNLLPVYEPYLMTRHKPEFYQPEGHTGRKAQMNRLIKQLATAYGLSFLDLHHLFEKVGNVSLDVNSLIKNEANSKTTDGLHPTPDGYRVIGVAVYEHLINNDLPRRKIVCFGDSITIGDGQSDGANYPAYLKKLLNS